MNNKRRIYCLNGLSEETLAVCFAKCSRSGETFDVIAKELSDEKSGKFHEKWVVGYGHSSVAEHAVVRLAMENVSLLAVEWIQDNRLASYTEKSSRYQIYDKNRYVIPEDVKRDKRALKLYKNAADGLLGAYHEMIEPLNCQCLKQLSGQEYSEAKIKGMCMDQARFLLPAGMMANLGMTANARVWEYAISKWLSSGIDEVIDMAKEVKKEVEKSCPVLVKYAAENKYLKDIYFQQITNHKLQITKNKNKKPVRVVDWDRDALDKIVASLIYKKSFGEYKKIERKLKAKSKKYKIDVLKKLLKNRTEHDRLPRDFEHIYISFDVLCDQGAYYDFKRNRMMTQIRQDLGVENGYMMPKMIKEIGMDKKYNEVIKKAEEAYFEIRKKYPISAQYLVTKAHNRRFLMKMNLRELFYFVRLRARKAGNFAYRRIAMAILEEAKKKYPEIMKLFFEEKELDSRGSIEKEYFYKFV